MLTGGGSLGAIQVGMLGALHDHGIEPDLLVGTSAGALNAAYLAGPGSTEVRLGSLADLWRRARRRDVFVTRPRRWLAATVGAAPSLFADIELRTLVQRNLGFDLLEDARMPLHVVACDLVTGLGVALTEGPVTEAVLASSAVPGLLPPVQHDGRTLVDGGVGEFDALGHADAQGVDEIYLLPAGYPCAGSTSSTAVGTMLIALSLVLHRQLLTQVHSYSGRARLHVLPPLCPLSVSPADFTHAPALLRRSHRVTSEWLARDRGAPATAAALSLHEHPDHASMGHIA